jgi:cold shock CspA family protein
MHPTDEKRSSTTGIVEWYDAMRGVGIIRPDDGTAPCGVRSDTLRDCGISSLTAGDRVRFQIRDEAGQRTATDLALLRAVQRWESEGGAVGPDPPEA